MPNHIPPKSESETRKDKDREAKTDQPKKEASEKAVSITDFASI